MTDPARTPDPTDDPSLPRAIELMKAVEKVETEAVYERMREILPNVEWQKEYICSLSGDSWQTHETLERTCLTSILGELADVPSEVLAGWFVDADVISNWMMSQPSSRESFTPAATVMVKLWVRCLIICEIVVGRLDLDVGP